MAFQLLSRVLLVSISLLSSSAYSAIVTYNLTGTVVTPGPFIGSTGSGSFSYNEADITGDGTETIHASSSLTVDFTIFGQTFTETDDIAHIDFGTPDLKFFDGVPVFLDFFLSEIPSEGSTNVVAINEPGVISIDMWNPTGINLTPVAGGFEATVSVNTVVPVPAAVWLFCSGLIGLIGVARRKKV